MNDEAPHTERSMQSFIAQGDLVKLRSGGALMTVAAKVGPICVCEWQDAHGTPHRHAYDEKVLVRVPTDLTRTAN